MSNVSIGNNILIGGNVSIGNGLFTGNEYEHYKILVVSESKYFSDVCAGDFDDIFLDALGTQGINLGGAKLADCAAFMNYDAYQPPQLSQAIAALAPDLILALLKEESKQSALNATGSNVYDATPHVRAPFKTVFRNVMKDIVEYWNGRVRFDDREWLWLNSNKGYPINLVFLGGNADDFDDDPNWRRFNYSTKQNLRVDTVVGVYGTKPTNDKLYPKLNANPYHIARIQKHYDGCFYVRSIKVKASGVTRWRPAYFHIYRNGVVPNNANLGVDGTFLLKDYIDVFFGANPPQFMKRSVRKDACINELIRLGNSPNNDQMQKLYRSSCEYFDMSEYLDICSPPVDIIALASRNNAAPVNAFKDEINRHVEGMILIDRIY